MAKRIVIVGGGFGGLQAAKVLGRSPKVRLSVIDRKNHFLFQPLLYQVATASLSPSDIGAPIRQVLARYRNTQVHLDTALSVDLAGNTLVTDTDRHPFDYLILACGSSHSYFGHDDWEDKAPGLKTIEQALEVRRRLLIAFEAAEKEGDSVRQRKLLTFVIIGGGPTGVELAGAVSELGHGIARNEFRNIRPERIRVVLAHAGDRLLETFHPELSESARLALEGKGVEVILGHRAEDVTAAGVTVAGGLIETATVMWAAGVKPSPLNALLGVALDKEGRVPVGADLSLHGHRHIFVIGDQARSEGQDGPMPGLAPVAMQQGRLAARNILRDLEGKPRKAFCYVDKGTMAVIGRAYAVAQIKALRLTGLPAWLIWVWVHISFLVSHRNRVLVMLNWAWSYFTMQRGSRLITWPTWRESEAPHIPTLRPTTAPPGTLAKA